MEKINLKLITPQLVSNNEEELQPKCNKFVADLTKIINENNISL